MIYYIMYLSYSGNNIYIAHHSYYFWELFMYRSYCCKHPCFSSLSQIFEKAETYISIRSIKNSTIEVFSISFHYFQYHFKYFVCISPRQCHKNKNPFPFHILCRWNAKGFEKSSDLPMSRMSFKSSFSCFISYIKWTKVSWIKVFLSWWFCPTNPVLQSN